MKDSSTCDIWANPKNENVIANLMLTSPVEKRLMYVYDVYYSETTIQYCKRGGKSETALMTPRQIQKIEHEYFCHIISVHVEIVR